MSSTTAQNSPALKTEGEAKPLGQTSIYFASFVAIGLTTGALGPTLPGLAMQTDASLSQISYLFTARSLGYLLGSFAGGKLYDRAPGHHVLCAMLAALALTMALVPFAPGLLLLAVVSIISGCMEGSVDVGGNTLLIWLHGSRAAPYMNGLHFSFGVGAFLAPILVARMLSFNQSAGAVYLVLSVLILPVAAWALRYPSPSRPSVLQSQQEERFDRRLVALFAIMFFLYVGAEISFGGWIFTYVTQLQLGSPAGAAYLTSAFWGALTFGRLASIPLARRLRPRHILFTNFAGSLLSVALILIWPASVAAVWVGAVGMGFFMASIFPTLMTMAGRHLALTGSVTGYFIVGASAGSMTLPWVVGQLFDVTGAAVIMIVVASALAAAAGALCLLLRCGRRAVIIKKNSVRIP